VWDSVFAWLIVLRFGRFFRTYKVASTRLQKMADQLTRDLQKSQQSEQKLKAMMRILNGEVNRQAEIMEANWNKLKSNHPAGRFAKIVRLASLLPGSKALKVLNGSSSSSTGQRRSILHVSPQMEHAVRAGSRGVTPAQSAKLKMRKALRKAMLQAGISIPDQTAAVEAAMAHSTLSLSATSSSSLSSHVIPTSSSSTTLSGRGAAAAHMPLALSTLPILPISTTGSTTLIQSAPPSPVIITPPPVSMINNHHTLASSSSSATSLPSTPTKQQAHDALLSPGELIPHVSSPPLNANGKPMRTSKAFPWPSSSSTSTTATSSPTTSLRGLAAATSLSTATVAPVPSSASTTTSSTSMVPPATAASVSSTVSPTPGTPPLQATVMDNPATSSSLTPLTMVPPMMSRPPLLRGGGRALPPLAGPANVTPTPVSTTHSTTSATSSPSHALESEPILPVRHQTPPSSRRPTPITPLLNPLPISSSSDSVSIAIDSRLQPYSNDTEALSANGLPSISSPPTRARFGVRPPLAASSSSSPSSPTAIVSAADGAMATTTITSTTTNNNPTNNGTTSISVTATATTMTMNTSSSNSSIGAGSVKGGTAATLAIFVSPAEAEMV
jgi:hypothetical protein